MDMPIWKLNEHFEKGQGGSIQLPDGTATIQVNGQECYNGKVQLEQDFLCFPS